MKVECVSTTTSKCTRDASTSTIYMALDQSVASLIFYSSTNLTTSIVVYRHRHICLSMHAKETEIANTNNIGWSRGRYTLCAKSIRTMPVVRRLFRQDLHDWNFLFAFLFASLRSPRCCALVLLIIFFLVFLTEPVNPWHLCLSASAWCWWWFCLVYGRILVYCLLLRGFMPLATFICTSNDPWVWETQWRSLYIPTTAKNV